MPASAAALPTPGASSAPAHVAAENEPKPAPVRPPVTAAPSPRAPADESAPPEPPVANARLDHAESLLEAGRFAAALAEAHAILKREPGNSDAQQLAEEAEASLLIETSLKKARQALSRGDKEAALEELKKGLAANSNDARLLALWREATQ
jgi:tetratricopeptide (TPR) repeat protein